jgi:hypothetical protein
MFTQRVEQMSANDGSNTHQVLSKIFRTMHIKVSKRTNTDLRLCFRQPLRERMVEESL